MNVLHEIDRQVRERPEATAIVHRMGRGKVETVTFAELDRRSNRLANALIARGLKPGQIVGLALRKSVEHVVAALAAHKAGAAYFSANVRLGLEQLRVLVDKSLCPFLLIDNGALMRLGKTTPDDPMRTRLIHYTAEPFSPIHQALFKKVSEATGLERLATDDADLPDDRPDVAALGSDMAVVLFTSGSTGEPKGVMISHQDLANRVASEIAAYRLTSEDNLLSLLPFGFDVGLNQLFTSLASGATLVILNSWLAPDIHATVDEQAITGISSVPAIWADFIAHDAEAARRCFERLRYITVSGGDMSEAQLRRLRELAPATDIYKTYGQTEAFRPTMLRPEDFDRKMTTVGRAVPGTEVFVLTKDGRRAAPDEPGEVVFRGDGMMIGYLDDPDATRRKIRDHPLQAEPTRMKQKVVFTGDQGQMDAEGCLTLLGRRDKMLKVRGNRVYPREIQDQIVAHPDVIEAAVFGVKDAQGQTEVVAEVRVRDGAQNVEAALPAFLNRRLPTYMVPSRVVVVETFPRTPSGKIRLAAIEARYAREQSS